MMAFMILLAVLGSFLVGSVGAASSAEASSPTLDPIDPLPTGIPFEALPVDERPAFRVRLDAHRLDRTDIECGWAAGGRCKVEWDVDVAFGEVEGEDWAWHDEEILASP